MIRGFVSLPGGALEPLSSLDDVAAASTRDGAQCWIDVEDPDLEGLRALGRVFGLDEEAVADCVEGEQRPRVDEFGDHLFMVLYGAVGPEEFTEFKPRKISIFFCSRFLITVHHDSLRTINTLLKRVTKRSEIMTQHGLDYMLYSVIDLMVDNYGLIVEEYSKKLDRLEDRSLDARGDTGILSELLDLRRELLDVRRIVASKRELVVPIAAGEMDYISKELEPRFSHVRDHLTTTLEIIDSHRELLYAIRDNYNLWLSNRMNEVMKVLTIFASFFLPLSLIAGIYGMNMPLWPPSNDPLTTWIIIGLMLVTAVGMLIYFRRKKWL